MKATLAQYRKVFTEKVTGEVPVYLLVGEERFIMMEMAERITSSVLETDEAGFNHEVHYGSEADMEAILSTANSFPFLGDKRVIVIRELERMKGGWKELAAYAGDPSSTTVMVLMFGTHDPDGKRIKTPREFQSLVKGVEKQGKVIKFDQLRSSDLVSWVKQKASRMGVEMSGAQASALISSVGEDLFSIKNELDKISLVFEGNKVTDENLASVIGKYRMNVLRDFIDSLEPGREPYSMELLSSIIGSGAERVSVIIYQLIRHFLTLLKIKAGRRYGGYMYERAKKKADMYSTQWIMLWLENLRAAEIILKSVSFPEELLLEGAVLHSMKRQYFAGPQPLE